MGEAGRALEVDASHAVRAVVASIGRTEDIRFSPSGSRLAIAAFTTGRIAFVDLKVAGGENPGVALADAFELDSPELSSPHGLDFLDEETLVVANRTGGVAVLRIKEGLGGPRLENVLAGGGVHDRLLAPGSIAVVRDGTSSRLLVCDNDGHVVTSHQVESGPAGVVVAEPEVLIGAGLDIPDGVARSADGRWLAVSNHHTNSVLVFDTTTLEPEGRPACVLRGVRYPHGLRFVDDGRALLVADAGSPHLLAFHRRGDEWRGVLHPDASLQVIDDEVFRAGQRNPEEGGPKGIDVDPEETVVAVTSETLPLAFFPLAPLLAPDGDPDLPALHLDYEMHVTERLLAIKRERADAITRAGAAEHQVGLGQIEIGDLRGRLDAADAARAAEAERADGNQRWAEAERARAEAAEAHLRALQSTKLFRLAAPLRRAYSVLTRAGGGR